MPVAIILRLDAAMEAAVRHLAGVPWDAYPPHITLWRGEHLPEAPATAQALTLTLHGLGVFPGPPPIWYLAPVVTAELLACQAALPVPPPHPHTARGAWVPHVTLPIDDPAAALARWSGPITGHVVALEVVRFPPPVLLARATAPSCPAAAPRRA